MRLFPALLLAACFSLPVMADSLEAESASAEAIQAAPGQQSGIYRFGATYEFTNTATIDDCQQLCNTRPACLAWSYIEALDEGAARCELKRGAGKVERNPLATSGLSSQHEDRHQPVLEVQEELQGGSNLASPPSDKPEPLVATDPA
jgi:PAN domain-containing protein